MKIQLDLGYLLVSIVSLLTGLTTMTGDLQRVIPFSTTLSEIALCVLSLLLCMFTGAAAFEFHVNTKNSKV